MPGSKEFNAGRSALGNAVSLPAKFLCRDCSKPKHHSMFSQKELSTFRFKTNNGQKLDWVSAKLRCRDCTGTQATEYLCAGPCSRWKDASRFSKANRKRGDDCWCMECVAWKDNQEDGIPVGPAPGGDYNESERRNNLTGDSVATTATAYTEDGNGSTVPATFRSASTRGDRFFEAFAGHASTAGSVSGNISLASQRGATEYSTSNVGAPSNLGDLTNRFGSASISTASKPSVMRPGSTFKPDAYRNNMITNTSARGEWARPYNINGKGGLKNFTVTEQDGRPGWDSAEESADEP